MDEARSWPVGHRPHGPDDVRLEHAGPQDQADALTELPHHDTGVAALVRTAEDDGTFHHTFVEATALGRRVRDRLTSGLPTLRAWPSVPTAHRPRARSGSCAPGTAPSASSPRC